MDARLATATVKLRLDINFGDPVTPAPQQMSLPGLRPASAPIEVLGYPVETVLAEKITTAIDLADANTRVRDFVDIYTVTGSHTIPHAPMHAALLATAEYRGVEPRWRCPPRLGIWPTSVAATTAPIATRSAASASTCLTT